MTAGLIIGAARSGAGKTTVTLGLIAALRRRGVAVRTAKSGPDYIDPAFHAAASGRPGVNLDSWAMPPGLLDALVGEIVRSAPPPQPSPTRRGEGEMDETPLPLVGRGRGWGDEPQRHRDEPSTQHNIVMAGLDPATHAVRRQQAAPGKHCAAAHAPVMRSRVGGRIKSGHDGFSGSEPYADTHGTAPPDILIVESAMGLFDGVAAPPGRSGSAADLAARFGLPVLLVLDISGQAQTAAAIARGFSLHDPAVAIAGVILNQVASERHRRMAADAIAAIGLPVLGAIPRDASLTLPERHLGLVQAAEHPALAAHLERLAELATRHLDLDAIQAAARPLRTGAPSSAGRVTPPGQRIALAQDAAFSFIYPHLLTGWRAAGAEILPYAPLADEPPPPEADSAWLPGGYPELHAGRLAAATRFRAGLQRFAETRPVHGECGGYMVLGAGLIDAEGQRHAMTGLLSHSTSFARRKLNLGYRVAVLADATRIRGHEFHYTTLADPGDEAPFATLSDAAGATLGPAGGRRGNVSGSFFHIIATEDLQ